MWVYKSYNYKSHDHCITECAKLYEINKCGNNYIWGNELHINNDKQIINKINQYKRC